MCKEQIVNALYEAGFDLVRITSPATPATYPYYEDWLERGQAADLDWLGRDDRKMRREKLDILLPDIQSVILVAISYGERSLEKNPNPQQAAISAYACRPDYHKIIDKKLKKAVKALQHDFGAQGRFSVDYGAVLERDLAARAGIGFFGKSTMLINQQLGTSFFIGEILTTLKLETDDQPVDGSCGGCRICEQQCPTGAISLFSVNTARCISYLTIENSGPIPEELRPLMGNRVFGCDTCQAVCPHNQKRLPEFSANPDGTDRPLQPFWQVTAEDQVRFDTLRHLSLDFLLQLDEADFKALFRGTPILRPGFEGFMRNCAVAAGNSNQPQLIDQLTARLGTISPLVDEHLNWAISQLRLASTD